jgi:hypothetical protein
MTQFVILYGSRGWIGSMFADFLNSQPTCICLQGQSRCDQYDELRKELERYRERFGTNLRVVSMIGRTSGPGNNTIDYLEQPGKLRENINDNLYSPIILAQICSEFDIHFTYLGTGCIFSYDKNQNAYEKIYQEESEPDFFGSSYSIVKGMTDRLFHQRCFSKTVLNVRIRMPIVEHDCPKNFISKIIRYKKICSTINSMSVLPTLFPSLYESIRIKRCGTINLVNPGAMDHNQILKMYKTYVDPGFVWENFDEQAQSEILIAQRSKNVLQSSFPEVISLSDAIKKLFMSGKFFDSM